jgi:hypothetical protein
MKAKETFLERNKKKSLLAALLLFLREHKALVVLLFLVLAASAVFVTPSSWVAGVPGGDRFAAGVVWVAGKLGVDVSRWGLGPSGRRSYADLLEAFRLARTNAGGGIGAGWGPFFGRGAGAGSPNSTDFVKGRRSDLDGTRANGAGGNQTIQGIVDPADAKMKDGTPVAIKDDDLGGEREKSFERGFVNGMLGSPGAPGAGGVDALSGGPYAKPGFFSGGGGAASAQSGDLARSSLQGVGTPTVPASRIAGAAKGQLSAMASKGVDARATKGMASVLTSCTGSKCAFPQLFSGNARDQLGATYCLTSNCPGEYFATNSGAIYDGNTITSGFLTSSDPGGNAVGMNSTVDVPPSTDLANQDAAAEETGVCQADAMACQKTQADLATGFVPIQNAITAIVPQLPGACIKVCDCGACDSLNGTLTGQCNAMSNLNGQISNLSCNMPGDCASLGVATPANPESVGSTCPNMGCQECPHILGICMCWL